MTIVKAIVAVLAMEVRDFVVKKVNQFNEQRQQALNSAGARMRRVRGQLARTKGGPPRSGV